MGAIEESSDGVTSSLVFFCGLVPVNVTAPRPEPPTEELPPYSPRWDGHDDEDDEDVDDKSD